jgi:hypothetical protein
MLTPQALERASGAYRRGYYDGYDRKPHKGDEYTMGTFAAHDYANGYLAGGNDRRWSDKQNA